MTSSKDMTGELINHEKYCSSLENEISDHELQSICDELVQEIDRGVFSYTMLHARLFRELISSGQNHLVYKVLDRIRVMDSQRYVVLINWMGFVIEMVPAIGHPSVNHHLITHLTVYTRFFDAFYWKLSTEQKQPIAKGLMTMSPSDLIYCDHQSFIRLREDIDLVISTPELFMTDPIQSKSDYDIDLTRLVALRDLLPTLDIFYSGLRRLAKIKLLQSGDADSNVSSKVLSRIVEDMHETLKIFEAKHPHSLLKVLPYLFEMQESAEVPQLDQVFKEELKTIDMDKIPSSSSLLYLIVFKKWLIAGVETVCSDEAIKNAVLGLELSNELPKSTVEEVMKFRS